MALCAASFYIVLMNDGLQDRPSSEDKMTIKSIVVWVDSWRRYRVAVAELSQLSDRELHDLGITRSEIHAVARQSSGI